MAMVRDWIASAGFRPVGQKCIVDSKTAEDCGEIREAPGD
jgi:hypothetical protein